MQVLKWSVRTQNEKEYQNQIEKLGILQFGISILWVDFLFIICLITSSERRGKLNDLNDVAVVGHPILNRRIGNFWHFTGFRFFSKFFLQVNEKWNQTQEKMKMKSISRENTKIWKWKWKWTWKMKTQNENWTQVQNKAKIKTKVKVKWKPKMKTKNGKWKWKWTWQWKCKPNSKCKTTGKSIVYSDGFFQTDNCSKIFLLKMDCHHRPLDDRKFSPIN